MRDNKIKIFVVSLITFLLVVTSFFLNDIDASSEYLTYSGVKTNASENINSFLEECLSSGKDAYFESGTYTLDQNIILKNEVSLLTDDENPAIFKSAGSQVHITTSKNNTENLQINGFVFDNVTIYIRHSNCNGIEIKGNIFMNAKNVDPIIDGGVSEDTGYYILVKNSMNVISSNIFLRDSVSLGRGIGLYKSSNCLIENNYFGLIEDLSDSIVTQDVKAKKSLIENLVNSNSNQGYFMTAINVISQDVNCVIRSNHISLNTDITEGTNANNDQIYHRDHLIYAKEFDGLDIVGNYFKGMNKNADGGIKVRNGQNVNIYKNVIVDNQVLLYVQDGSSVNYLKNVFIDSNIFINNYHTNITVEAGISNKQNKNLSDGWIIYLRSYSSSYVMQNITISNNLVTSQQLGNEQIRIHRRIGSSEYSMPSNFNIINNTNVLNEKLRVFDYAMENTITNEDYTNGNQYKPVITDYDDIDVYEIMGLYEKLEVNDGFISIPEDSFVFVISPKFSWYNGGKLAEGSYKIGIMRRSNINFIVEGTKTEDIPCEYITLFDIEINYDDEEIKYDFIDNYNLKKSETIDLSFISENAVYSSENESIATVSETGLVKAIGFGTTNIEVLVGNITYNIVVNVSANYTDFDFEDHTIDLTDEANRKEAGIYSVNTNAKVTWGEIQSSKGLKIINDTLGTTATTAEIELRNGSNLFNNNGVTTDKSIHLSTRILKQNAKVIALYLSMGGSTGTFQAFYFNTNKISYKYPTTSGSVNYTFEDDKWYDIDIYLIDEPILDDKVYLFINGELVLTAKVENELANYMTCAKFQVQNSANATVKSNLYIDRISVKEFVPMTSASIKDMNVNPNDIIDLYGLVKYNLGANVNNDFNKYTVSIDNENVVYENATNKLIVTDLKKNSKTIVTLNFANGVSTSFVINISLPVHEHLLLKVDEKTASCLEDGNVGYYYCETCNKNFDIDKATELDNVLIEKLGHDYKFVSNNDGTHKEVCANDSNHIIEGTCNIIWGDFKKEPTEFETGVQVGKCENCDYEVTRVVPSTHICEYEKDFTIDLDKTCISDGSKSKHCINENCDSKIEITVIPASHELIDVSAINKTCTKDGNIAHKHCEVCGLNFDNSNNVLENVTIPAAHRLIIVSANEASCLEDGNIAYNHCEDCGLNFDDQLKELHSVVVKGEHTLVNVDGVAATCTETGILEHKKCIFCFKLFDKDSKEISSVEIPVLEHEYSTKWSKDENKHWHECVCGSKKDEESHKYEEKIIKEPTSKEDGLLEKECICGEKHTEVIKSNVVGCLGSVSSSLISIVCLLVIVILFKKKENKND